jgi:FXSXX-COOH protein
MDREVGVSAAPLARDDNFESVHIDVSQLPLDRLSAVSDGALARAIRQARAQARSGRPTLAAFSNAVIATELAPPEGEPG